MIRDIVAVIFVAMIMFVCYVAVSWIFRHPPREETAAQKIELSGACAVPDDGVLVINVRHGTGVPGHGGPQYDCNVVSGRKKIEIHR